MYTLICMYQFGIENRVFVFGFSKVCIDERGSVVDA